MSANSKQNNMSAKSQQNCSKTLNICFAYFFPKNSFSIPLPSAQVISRFLKPRLCANAGWSTARCPLSKRLVQNPRSINNTPLVTIIISGVLVTTNHSYLAGVVSQFVANSGAPLFWFQNWRTILSQVFNQTLWNDGEYHCVRCADDACAWEVLPTVGGHCETCELLNHRFQGGIQF